MPSRDDVLLGALCVRSGLLPAERYWALVREWLGGPPERSLADFLVERGIATREQLSTLERLGSNPALTVMESPAGATHAHALTIASERPTRMTIAEGATPPSAEDGRESAIGKYRILGELGRGGMGVVYKALDPATNRTVALKVLPPGSGSKDDAIHRFQREVRTAASLRHTNIVAIHDVGSADGAHYFTMDYVEGTSLSDRVARGDLSVRDALDLVRTIAQALHYAHEQGIVHRDIKPSNILLDRRGTPYLTDFGLAKEIDSSTRLTFSGQVMGTPSYMSPEQANGELDLLDGCSDVYSLGAVLYECLTQSPPFSDPSPAVVLYKTLHTDPEPIRKRNPRVHADVETICLKALQKERPQRYATAAALAEDLRRFLDGEPIVARPVGPLTRVYRSAKKHRVAVGVVALAFAATGGITVHLRAERARVEQERDRERAAAERRRRAEERTRDALLLRGAERVTGLQDALAIDPAHAPARLALGVEHYRKGDFASAWRDLAEAARLAPEDPRVAFAVARFQEEVLLDRSAAGDRLRGVAERKPSALAGRLARAGQARLAGDPGKALPILAELLAIPEVEAAAQRESALCHQERANWGAAKHAANRALTLEPDDLGPHWTLAEAARSEFDYDTAIHHLDAFLTRFPFVSAAHHQRGRILLAQGDPAGAIAAFSRALDAPDQVALALGGLDLLSGGGLPLQSEPLLPESLLRRAEAHLSLGDAERGRADLERLTRQHPRDARGWNALGRLHLAAARLDEARPCLDRAIELDPGLAEAHALSARVAPESGRPALLGRALALERAEGAPWTIALVRAHQALLALEGVMHNRDDRPVRGALAERAYRDTLAWNPESSYARLGLARTRLAMLDPKAALEEIDRSVAANPRNPDAWLLRGVIARDYPSLSLADRAGEDFARAAELDPGDPEVWFSWGAWLEKQGEPDAAIEKYDRALALDAGFVPAHSRRSECHLSTGRRDQAERDYSAWRKLPNRDDVARRFWSFAEAYEDAHDYARAIAFYEQAIDWNWRGGYLYSCRARVLQRRNMLGDYVLDLARALEVEPQDDAKKYTDFWTIRTKLPVLLSMAIREVELHAPKRDHEPAAHFALGFVSLLGGNMKRAVEKFSVAIERNPDFLTARTLRAFCLHRIGKREEGRRELLEVEAKHPRKSLVRYFLACLEAADGRTDEALRLLESAVNDGLFAAEVAATQGEFKSMRDDPRFQRLLRAK